MTRCLVLLGLIWVLLAHSVVAGTPSNADYKGINMDILVQNCASCHGHSKNHAIAMPVITCGKHGSLAQTLQDYRDGLIPATIMDRIMAPFSDDDINALVRALNCK